MHTHLLMVREAPDGRLALCQRGAPPRLVRAGPAAAQLPFPGCLGRSGNQKGSQAPDHFFASCVDALTPMAAGSATPASLSRDALIVGLSFYGSLTEWSRFPLLYRCAGHYLSFWSIAAVEWPRPFFRVAHSPRSPLRGARFVSYSLPTTNIPCCMPSLATPTQTHHAVPYNFSPRRVSLAHALC